MRVHVVDLVTVINDQAAGLLTKEAAGHHVRDAGGRAAGARRVGDLEGAISFCDAAVESQGSTPYVWLARGDVLLARKEKRADYCFERALALANNHWLYRWLTSRIQSFHRQFARALKAVQDGLTLEPGGAVLWLQTGECQLALGLSAQARTSFEQARELDPELPIQSFITQADETTVLDKVAGRWRQWFGK